MSLRAVPRLAVPQLVCFFISAAKCSGSIPSHLRTHTPHGAPKHINRWVRANIHTHTQTHTHTHTHQHTHKHTHTYTHIHTHMHAHTHTHIYVTCVQTGLDDKQAEACTCVCDRVIVWSRENACKTFSSYRGNKSLFFGFSYCVIVNVFNCSSNPQSSNNCPSSYKFECECTWRDTCEIEIACASTESALACVHT